MVDITEVAENIYMIDNQLFSVPKFGSVYLVNEDKKALIDIGPTTSVNVILSGIRSIGVSPEDINYIIVTHIHLDHAGGVGVIIKEMPGAQVLVHPRGARHLANPARLIESVKSVQGAEIMSRYGEVLPVSEGRIKSASDGDVLKLSDGQSLHFIDAPGHAPHELCIYEDRNRGIFTGEAVGIYIAGDSFSLPSTPPPSFDAEQCVAALERMRRLNPDRLYFAHFGATEKVEEVFQLAIDKLKGWDDMAKGTAKDNDFAQLQKKLVAQGLADVESVRQKPALYKELSEVIVPQNAAGYIKYYREKMN